MGRRAPPLPHGLARSRLPISCLRGAFLSDSSTPHPYHTRLLNASCHNPHNLVYWHYQAFLTLRLRSDSKPTHKTRVVTSHLIMDASMASYQARLATFEGAATTKSRRSSSRSKKAPKAKAAWPLAAPSAQDLAYSGFVWRPTPASPDNVQCWACNCQLDGWEEEDVPAYEHLTHSPSCGFAVVTAIRLRHGDPGRTEEAML
jgi:hypothetical protein